MSRRRTRTTLAIALAAGFALACLAACGGPERGPKAGPESPGEAPAENGRADESDPGSEAKAPRDEAARVAGGEEESEERRKRCRRAVEHVVELIEERGGELEKDHRQKAYGEGVDQCAADASRAELDCVLAARELEDVKSCEGGGV